MQVRITEGGEIDSHRTHMMHNSEIRKIAFVGDYLPRKCGIATFTHDMHTSVSGYFPNAECFVVPVNDRPKRNPLSDDPDAPIAGLKLFEQHCSNCHGTGGEGTRRAPRLASPQMQHSTPGEIFWILTNGLIRHGMPSWSRLPPPQRWQIVSFLVFLNEQQTPPSTIPAKP